MGRLMDQKASIAESGPPSAPAAVRPADLVPAATLKALHRRTNWQGLVHITLQLAALAGSGALIWLARGTWWLLPAMFVHGVQMVFLFGAHHECVHQSPFRSKWIGTGLNFVLGLILFYPPKYLWHFHMTHHRHTQDPALDPEIAVPLPTTRASYLWFALGPPYWRRRLQTSLRHALTGKAGQPFIPERDKSAIVREARQIWLIYLGAAIGTAFIDPWILPLYWLGPAVLGQPALRLYQIMEHGGAAFGDQPFRNARTLTTNPVMRWYHWNMPYHAEHHLFPNVPFHALPKLRPYLLEQLEVVEPGYVAGNLRYWRALGENALPRTDTDPPLKPA